MAKDHKTSDAQPVVNDLIFKELIKRGYSLEGKTRVWNIADSKLWYLTPEQAQAYLDIEDEEKYKKEVTQKETDLIEAHIKEIILELGKDPLNIIDLGCGDGRKASLLIDRMKGKLKIRYCPIDISDYMIEKALGNVKKTDVDEIIKVQWNISDFENIENISNLLRVGSYKKNFFLILGNTLGNFEINELLYEIRSAMKEGDYLLIGNGLDNANQEEILRSYQTKEQDLFMKKIVTQLGIKEEDLEYGVRFVNSRIEAYYTILKDCKISFLGKKIAFNKGDQIIVGVSYKYDKDDFTSFLKMYFSESDIFVSDDKSYALALCKK